MVGLGIDGITCFAIEILQTAKTASLIESSEVSWGYNIINTRLTAVDLMPSELLI